MPLNEYYLGVADINISYDRTKGEIIVESPELFNADIRAPISSIHNEKKLNILVTAFKRRVPHMNGRDNLLCSYDLIELLKEVQGEPDLLEKIIAVTEAHRALNQ